ncbi:MAG: TonB-dependent receptor [Pseudomonadota bacterium]
MIRTHLTLDNAALKTLLLATTSTAIAAFAAPSAALAQAIGASEAPSDQIVVSARRRAESLQDVPASVSAFSENKLALIGATDATGLQGAVPNLNIVQGRGSSNATNIYIRGVGQPDALQTFDPAVGFYVDDVYYSRIRGTQLDLFDIERIEVLRGPQGTLYGKNTIGGALKVVTRRPDQETHGLAQLTVGNYGQVEGRVSVSGPLTDTLAGGAAFFGATRDGYVTNPTTDEEYNDRNVRAGRVSLAWDPAENIKIDWAADYSEENNALVLGQPINTLTTLFGVPLLVLPDDTPEFDFTATPTPGLPNSQDLRHWGTGLNATWELSENFSLKSITAFRDLEYTDYIDIDASTLETGDVLVDVVQDQFSQELQAIYEGDSVAFVGGLYFLRENVSSHQEAFADDLLSGPGGFTFLRTIDDDLTTKSWAAFGNVTVAITDRLNVSGGIRYTRETKDYFRSTSTFSTFPGFTIDPAFAFTIDDSWTDWTPSGSIDFQASDRVLVYARVSQGFKSGGFNGRANNPGEQAPYEPETATSYEMGLKSDWLNNALLVNVAGFYNKYNDFQARVSGLTIDPGTMLPSPELTVLNAGSLDIFGAELELAYSPIPALVLDAQIGYLDAEYGDFADERFVSFGGDRSFQQPAFSPKWTTRIGATYEADLGAAGTVRLAGSARFRTRMALAVDNTFIDTDTEIAGLFQDDYWLFDANLLWTHANEIFSLGVYGRNLSDEVYRTDGQEFSAIGNIRTVYYGAPRTVSVVATARF